MIHQIAKACERIQFFTTRSEYEFQGAKDNENGFNDDNGADNAFRLRFRCIRLYAVSVRYADG
jgi:hypothetical protein